MTTEERLNHLIATHNWRFAKSMPWCPHFYTVRDKDRWNDEDYNWFVGYILQHGTDRFFYKKKLRYLAIGEYKYWPMIRPGEDINTSFILNRAKLTPEEIAAGGPLDFVPSRN